jgi:hypothetical protein
MTIEKWIKKPYPAAFSGKYSISSVNDCAFKESCEFDVILASSENFEKKIVVSFGCIISHSNFLSLSRNKKVEKIEKEFGIGFFDGKSFFEIFNSEYAKWLAKNSGGIFEESELRHFSFVDKKMFLNILSIHGPKEIKQVQ